MVRMICVDTVWYIMYCPYDMVHTIDLYKWSKAFGISYVPYYIFHIMWLIDPKYSYGPYHMIHIMKAIPFLFLLHSERMFHCIGHMRLDHPTLDELTEFELTEPLQFKIEKFVYSSNINCSQTEVKPVRECFKITYLRGTDIENL